MSDHLKHTLKDVIDALDQHAVASDGIALKTAKALHASNTLGFRWLVTGMSLEGVDLPRVIAILNKLPRQAVKDLKERIIALDKIYGGPEQTLHIIQRTQNIILRTQEMGGAREVIDEWLDLGTGWMDETKEAEAVMMQQVLDEVIPLLPNHNYLSVLEIVSEWYT